MKIAASEDPNASATGPALPAVEPLGRLERITAVAVGAAAGGGGGYAVFASSNQAGTAILLILSAIFLLVGIQGTSLVRFSTGTNTVELERRKRVEEALEEATQEPDLERAEGIVEGISIAQPSLPSLPEAQARLYARRLQLAFEQMGYETMDSRLDLPVGNLSVRDNQGRTVVVEAIYVALGIRAHVDMDKILMAARRLHPVLFVANAPFSSAARRWEFSASGEGKIGFITWRDERDNDLLRDALTELLATSIP